jgi:glycosyltransferase involved in cell wall biosynthesis
MTDSRPAPDAGAAQPGDAPLVSVLIPAKNEVGNIGTLVGEVVGALRTECTFEIVLVDDGSDDGTGEAFVQSCIGWGAPGRLVRHQASMGQSTALYSAALQARGRYLITIDGDGQNDPADMPGLLRAAREAEAQSPHFCIAGYRQHRQDSGWKKFQSRVANAVRQKLLADQVPDTGCGLKLIPRETWQRLPYFDHMHRYLPALVLRLGGEIRVVPVNHRARQTGMSKYNAWNRLWVGLVDMAGVMWLTRRSKRPVVARMQSIASHDEPL